MFADGIEPCGDDKIDRVLGYVEEGIRGSADQKPNSWTLTLGIIMAKEDSRQKIVGENIYKEYIILSISVQVWRRHDAWQHKLPIE